MRIRTKSLRTGAAFALMTALFLPRSHAADSVLDLIPSECDVIVGLNVQSLLESSLFNRLIDEQTQRKEFEAEMRQIKEMSHIEN